MLRSFVDPFVIGRPVVQLAKFMRQQCEHRGVRLNSVCVRIGGAGIRLADQCGDWGWFGVVVRGMFYIFVRPPEEVFRELDLFNVV